MASDSFFSYRKDQQGNYLVYYETIPLGYVFLVGGNKWCADNVRNNDYHQNVPEPMQGMLIGFIDKEHAAFYLYRMWQAYKQPTKPCM
jgi:hypothetical protein